MPNVPALIGDAWRFARNQPVLLPVTLLYLLVPTLGLTLLPRLEQGLPYFRAQTAESSLVLLLLSIALNVLIVWGSTCVMLVARRVLQAKAGRTRTSLRAVSAQAAPFFLPYLLTGILRAIVALLWGILFLAPIVALAWILRPSVLTAPATLAPADLLPWMLLLLLPAIAALASYLRTAFSPVHVVCEDIAYRPALRKSSRLVRSRPGSTLLALVLLVVLLFGPSQLLIVLLSRLTGEAPLPLGLLADLIAGVLQTAAGTFYLIGLTLLYDSIRPRAVVSN